MTTNSPNPVDGDVQALIERLNRIVARLKWNNVGYAQDVLKAVDLLTAPPAQLLRPVELPEVQRLNATAQPVSDWQKEAERMAELHGMSFVVFRNGDEPKCADPTKVRIEFTDKGLGYPATPGGQDD